MDGAIAPVVVLDLAWNVGLLRARNAEKKLAKNGRCVGIGAIEKPNRTANVVNEW